MFAGGRDTTQSDNPMIYTQTPAHTQQSYIRVDHEQESERPSPECLSG